jgi:Domain of unknown function (DUF6438)
MKVLMTENCNAKLLSIMSLVIFVSGLPLLNIIGNAANAAESNVKVNSSAVSKTNQSSFDSNSVNITMSRGPCRGLCPVYDIEIDGIGNVLYRGYEHVNITGERKSNIAPEKVNELIKQFYNSGYFDLEDRYDQVEITDQPTVETSIFFNGTFKAVYDYLGTPLLPELQKLRHLEKMIDDVTNSSQWVGPQSSNG